MRVAYLAHHAFNKVIFLVTKHKTSHCNNPIIFYQEILDHFHLNVIILDKLNLNLVESNSFI